MKRNDQYGYINLMGDWVIRPQFQDAWRFAESLAVVKVDSQWGYLDRAGNVAINHNSTELLASQNRGPESGRAASGGFIDPQGKMAIAPQFDFASDFAQERAAVLVGSKWGYVDPAGKLTISPQFDYATDFSEGLAAVKVGNQMGFIDRTGRMQIEPQFENVGSFSEGWAWVQNGEQWRYVDSNGNFLERSAVQ
ncbi:MAG: WG repeat-containing protein [Leptolyngbyaceae cyanobacterium SM1_3_5]|nr:WG repeat-containing protein [Leptolyngbyaceae cyanobacterium SM1_3_5]